MNQWMDIHQTCMAIQWRRNDFDIGEACLTIAEGASVKGESRRGGALFSLGGGGASPRKF